MQSYEGFCKQTRCTPVRGTMFVARMMLEGDIFLGFLIGFDKLMSQLAVKCEVILSWRHHMP